jgi:ABC-type antimicrobial peptide transport system permease subunit
VRTDGDPAKVVNVIRSIWPSYFPSAIPSIQPASSVLAANYADDARMASLLALATGIALSLAAFGTYVLSADTVQRRAREIVLRKLHGASDSAIGLLVLRGVGTMLLLAALIGLPVAAVWPSLVICPLGSKRHRSVLAPAARLRRDQRRCIGGSQSTSMDRDEGPSRQGPSNVTHQYS